jgi:hypothetical protein
MESYQTWFGEGPELSVLRMLGLFDRPADEKALGALLKTPAIPGLTESLTELSPTEWRTILGKLRRARLLAPEDPHNPGHLDTHPLVREYFGDQLRTQRNETWKECNGRLYNYYRASAPQLPDSFKEMEPLFLAVSCGCNAGLLREALHEVYIRRIQRGNTSFAANILGVRGALLSVLAHFFQYSRWSSLVQTGIEEQSLTPEDQVFVLTQAGRYLTATRGMGAAEARICYERAEPLCHDLNRPDLLYPALMGQWRYSLTTDKLTTPMQIAKRVYSLAVDQNDPALMIGARTALAVPTYFMGDFESARQHAMSGVRIWRSGIVQPSVEGIDAPIVTCLLYVALAKWHAQEIASCHATMKQAISLAKELNDTHALANAVCDSAQLAYYERNVSAVESLASEVIELATRYNFAFWLAIGSILRGWARSALGDTAEARREKY